MRLANLKFVLLFEAILLVGCSSIPTSQTLGISDSEWGKYSVEEQQQLMANYQQISDQKEVLTEKQSKQNKSSKAKQPMASNGSLVVGIHSGKVMMAPFTDWQEYKPVVFNIKKGECKEVLLAKSDASSQVELGVCYKEKTLYLDPSKYDLAKQFGSITFNYSPLWNQGFTYTNINSSGFVRLQDVTVEINK
jgi:hypothetical protein